ncbi:MAG: hypothetical protein ACLFVX_00345 [Archaeoglobaceae archaeon]
MILQLLLLILIAGYIGINFFADLPLFLVGENLVYAALYALGLLNMSKRPVVISLIVLSAFNAGRVSRSVIEPTGELAPIAIGHLPLLVLILAVMFLLVRELVEKQD